jgi:ABC-type transporter Mla subunit MlaD
MSPARTRILALGALGVAVLIALVVSFPGTGKGEHQLWVNADDATGVTSGQKIRLAGRTIGQIGEVRPGDNGHVARIELRFKDEGWPLERGSKLLLRWGGTVSYLKRYVSVTRGPAGAPRFEDGDTIPAKSFSVPLEFDSLINEFTPGTRRDLRAFINRGGASLDAAGPWLKQTVNRAPPAVKQLDLVFTTLDRSQRDLHSLVASTGDVVNSLRAADPSVETAVSGAGRTLAATAQSAAALRRTLAAAPNTFTRIRNTLARTDTTLDLAGDVTSRLSPGVAELRRTVAPLNTLLTTVVKVGPDARSTLRTARTAAPDVTKLLDRGTRLMPAIDSLVTQALPQLDCIRPYTPEIVALTTNWAGFISSTDGRDHYVRINPAAIPWAPTNVQGFNTADAVKRFPGLKFGLPRPPGDNAGQPWYQPQCGITDSAYDPAADPESARNLKAPSDPARSRP